MTLTLVHVPVQPVDIVVTGPAATEATFDVWPEQLNVTVALTNPPLYTSTDVSRRGVTKLSDSESEAPVKVTL